ncbi:MAG: CPBP family intramembrane metalloprotease, partial [Oscillospiraceae bacterium]|nr:CPBP family intramembrane metalloprotease [Oscillospiraceae bacterium]
AVPIVLALLFGDENFTVMLTLACNGLAGFFALYCVFRSFMKPLDCRDEVGKAFGKPVSVKTFVSALFLGIALAMCAQQLSIWLQSVFTEIGLPENDPMDALLPKTYTFPTVAMLVLQLAVSPALLEEFAFRGVMLQTMRRYGDGFAILTTAILFGLFHGNIVQAPFAFLLGLVMGYLTVATGTIWTAIIIHFLNNLNAVVLLVLTENFSEAQVNNIYYLQLVLTIILGTAALMIFMKDKKRVRLAVPTNVLPKKEIRRTFYFSPGMIIFMLFYGFQMVSSIFAPMLQKFLTDLT